MKQRVIAPDGHTWIVQLVRSAAAGRSSRNGQLFGLLIDAVQIVLWPLVFALRVVLRRPWLVEAFRSDTHAEGAWRVHGLGAAESGGRDDRHRDRSRQP